jgi:hypothetical protein
MFAEETFMQSLGQGIVSFFFLVAIVFWLVGRKVKKMDKDGAIKEAAKGAAIRAIGNLFKK